MNNLDKQYTDLLQDILDNGVTKSDRTGTGTISIFGRQIRHKMSDGFPLLTTKKIPFKTIVTELLWFLRGDTNIKYLVDNGCHIWDGDAYKNYCNAYPDVEKTFQYEGSNIEVRKMTQEEFIEQIKTDEDFAKKWGNLGSIYGKQWRSWEVLHYDKTLNNTDSDIECYRTYIDQIANLINELKTNPDSRRLMVSAWNVGELDQMVLPPCHYGFQVYTRELSFEERWELAKKYGHIKSDVEVPSINSVYMGINERETMNGIWNDAVTNINLPTRVISLMWNQRSVDTFLGLPFNIASYGLLLEIIAKAVNMVPDELIGNLGDVHLYSNHIEQAKEQIGRELSIMERIDLADKKYDNFDIMDFGIPFKCTHEDIDRYYPVLKRTREPYPLPTLILDYRDGEYDKNLKEFVTDDFILQNYQSHPTIKAPLSN